MDFICLSYKNTDFLIEKSVIASSYYLGLKKSEEYSREISVEGKKVSAINFDYIVNRIFSDIGKSEESMVLKVGKLFLESSGLPYVKSIKISDFSLFGTVVDKFCEKKGILAVRYVENGRIQYLIDIEKVKNTFNEEI